VLSTDQKGAVAEAAIALAALELGLGVYRPYGDERCDLVFEVGSRLLRIQCKSASRHEDVIVVRCYRARRTAAGLLRQYYSNADVDAFAAYCPDVRQCYFIPFAEVPAGATLHLRLGPTRNNQARRIRWATDYDFAARLARLGAVAQLGERRAGSA
jgi:hypothetical protein